MIISWLIYLATAIGCAAFFVFYSDLLALIVLISVLCVPVLLFIIHITSFLLTKIEVEFDESQMGANKPVNLLIKVTNRSLFAITNIKLTSDFKNLFLNTEHSCKFVINAVPLSTKVFTYRLNSEHVGNVEFTLKKAQFFDFFSMFMLSKKLNIKKIVSLYPETVPVSSTIRPNNWFIGESDKFSNVKAGDDPSEVFNIREYVQGDKLNKIHWKLTSKTDTYMVKEYSLPVSDNVFVYLDLKAKDTSDESLTLVDSLIKSFASISLNFAKRGIVHYVGWYNSRRHIFVKTKIKSEPDVFVTLLLASESKSRNKEDMESRKPSIRESKASGNIFFKSITDLVEMFPIILCNSSKVCIKLFPVFRPSEAREKSNPPSLVMLVN